MREYLLRRLLLLIPTLLGVTFIVFLMMRILPSDPAKLMLYETGASAADIDKLRQQLGLSDPIYVQYWHYLTDIVQGNFGQSFYTKQSVVTMLTGQLPSTIQLALTGMVISIVVAFTLTLILAKRNSKKNSAGIDEKVA